MDVCYTSRNICHTGDSATNGDRNLNGIKSQVLEAFFSHVSIAEFSDFRWKSVLPRNYIESIFLSKISRKQLIAVRDMML